MKKTNQIIAVGLLILFFYQPAMGKTFLLTGEITDGLSLFTDPSDPWDYGEPIDGFPVSFVARLILGNENDWDFEFTTTDTINTRHYEIGGPRSVIIRPDLMTNNVLRTEESIDIKFQDMPLSFETFELSLDIGGQSGTWSWERNCPVCDLIRPLPAASAVITAVHAIPEPNTVVMVALLSVFAAFARTYLFHAVSAYASAVDFGDI